MDPIQNRFGYGAQAQSAALFDEGLRKHMLRVYNYMASDWSSPASSPSWSARRRRFTSRSSPLR